MSHVSAATPELWLLQLCIEICASVVSAAASDVVLPRALSHPVALTTGGSADGDAPCLSWRYCTQMRIGMRVRHCCHVSHIISVTEVHDHALGGNLCGCARCGSLACPSEKARACTSRFVSLSSQLLPFPRIEKSGG